MNINKVTTKEIRDTFLDLWDSECIPTFGTTANAAEEIFNLINDNKELDEKIKKRFESLMLGFECNATEQGFYSGFMYAVKMLHSDSLVIEKIQVPSFLKSDVKDGD